VRETRAQLDEWSDDRDASEIDVPLPVLYSLLSRVDISTEALKARETPLGI